MNSTSGIYNHFTGKNLSEFTRRLKKLSTGEFDDVRWDDLRAPATAINPPGQLSDPDWDNTNGGWLFAPNGTEVLWIIMQMPHAYKQGSSIRPHIHWQPINTDTGDVLWRMEYKWTNINDVDAGTFTTLNILTAGSGTALTHQINGFGEIDGTGKRISSILTLKLSRIGGDSTDTYNTDALLKEFDVHFQINSTGSRQEYIK